jgi:hypothetical protein
MNNINRSLIAPSDETKKPPSSIYQDSAMNVEKQSSNAKHIVSLIDLRNQ